MTRPLADPTFVAAAARRPQLWRLAAGLAVAGAIYLAGAAATIAGWVLLSGMDPAVAAETLIGGSEPAGLLVLLGSFAFMALGAWAAARWVHGRRLSEMFGPLGASFRDFAFAGGTVLALNLLVVIWYAATEPLVPGLPLRTWLTLLPLALALLGVQTLAEELLFRGYMQGQLMARFASPLVWMALPALAFGLLHYDPVGAGSNAWAVVATTFVFGLAAADLTALTGRLGAAWGFHFANNLIAILVIAVEDGLPALALARTPFSLSDPEAGGAAMLVDAVVVVLAWALVRTGLKRVLQHHRAANT